MTAAPRALKDADDAADRDVQPVRTILDLVLDLVERLLQFKECEKLLLSSLVGGPQPVVGQSAAIAIP